MINENKEYLYIQKKLRAKYFLDKISGQVLLFIGLPFITLIAWVIKIDGLFHRQNSGSILYTEPRISADRKFKIIKFRTVTKKGIDWIREKPTERSMTGCPFVTSAGKFIVNWYIDELPQLFNIIKGDMSFVGPRPHLISDYQKEIQQKLLYRKYIKAGLFGIPQACKRHPKHAKMFERIAKMHKSNIKVFNTIDGLYGRICIEYSIFAIIFFDFVITARCLYDYYARLVPFIPSKERI